MGKLLEEDETSLDGTTTILRTISKELQLKDEQLLAHGDQLTVNRIVGAQETLANEDTRADRLENFIPVPGGFHFRWKLLRLTVDNWWVDQHFVGSVSHARVFLGRKRVDQDASHFAHSHEMIEDLLEAHLLVLFWKLGGKDSTAQEIDEMIAAMIAELKKKEQEAGSLPHLHKTLVLAMLTYFDAHWATKAGNGDAIVDNERVALLYLLGSKKSKNYKVTTFNDLLTTLHLLPPYYARLSTANRVVNMQGENFLKRQKANQKQTKLTLSHLPCRDKRKLEGSGPPRGAHEPSLEACPQWRAELEDS